MADAYPPDRFMGEAVCLDARGMAAIPLLPAYERAVRPGDIVLVRTEWADLLTQPEKYYGAHPVLSVELCAFLLKRNIQLLGVDLPGPDRAPYPVHMALLARGIPIVENLCNLQKLEGAPRFTFQALPLRIAAEASPVRAVALL